MTLKIFKLRLNEVLPVWDLFISAKNKIYEISQPHTWVYESIKNGEGKEMLKKTQIVCQKYLVQQASHFLCKTEIYTVPFIFIVIFKFMNVDKTWT